MNHMLKAIFGGVSAGLTTYIAEASTGHVHAQGWAYVALSVVTAFGAVYGVTNIDKPPQP